ncbi:MAG: Fic family protein [Gemmatimonadota bacterium]
MKTPVPPPSFTEGLQSVLAAASRSPDVANALFRGVGAEPGGEYRHWDSQRHHAVPPPFTAEQYWTAIKLARHSLYRQLPLMSISGTPLLYAQPPSVLEKLHRVDRDAGRILVAQSKVNDPVTRDTYLIKSTIEEAITSSQLEGAATTRRVAKDMLLSGRRPRNRSERMIFNNYSAMEFVRELKNDPIAPTNVFELQRIVTDGTLDDPTAAGRFRNATEDIVIADEYGQLLHRPPPTSELSKRLDRLVEFANGGGSRGFIHPVIRAILVHFALAYDHPFVDGNGRTARALFYWVMAREGYWLCEYVSISRILRKAKAQYARAYLFTETDDNDTTYFIDYQLTVLLRAISDLHQYLGRKTEEMSEVEAAIAGVRRLRAGLNHRQLDLLTHALKNPSAEFSIYSHRRAHSIAYGTSRSDLLTLSRKKLLAQRKRGRQLIFSVPPDLRAQLQLLPGARGGRSGLISRS